MDYEDTNVNNFDGYGLLSYQGVSLTNITKAGTAAGERDITFTPLNKGVYYEIQARYTNDSYNWTDVSSAIDVHDGTEFPINIKNDIFKANDDTSLEIRALEWNKFNINTAINAQRVPNESPDSLILKSTKVGAQHVFYDWSKFEHNVTNNGTIVTASNTIHNSFSPSSVDVMDLTSIAVDDDSKYLSFNSHRSFDIQNGDFSIEFWINSNNSYESQRKNYIIKRDGGVEASISDDNKIQFIIGDYTLSSSFAQGQWAVSYTHLTLPTIYSV